MNLSGLACRGVGILLFVGTTYAFADEKDLLSINAAVSKTYLDNLFKRPADGSTGGVSRDELTTTRVTISGRKAVSLQGFELSATLTDNRYRQFSTLDSQSNSYNAVWRWRVAQQLSGSFSSSRQQSQTDFADYRGAGQNLRTTETKRANVDWMVMGGWTLGTGVTQTKNINSQTFAEDAGNEQYLADILIRYSFPSGTSLSVTRSKALGDYQRSPNPLTLSDSRFSDANESFSLAWPISGKTKLSASIGRISRHYENFNTRDYAGRNGNASLVWAPTGKTSVTLTWAKATDSWQDNSSSFSIRNSFGISGNLQLGRKLSFSANVGNEIRTFGGFALVPSPFNRRDKSNSQSFAVNWAPTQSLSIVASLQKAVRSSNSPGLSFSDQTASVSATVSF